MNKIVSIIENGVNADLEGVDTSYINPHNILNWDSLTHLNLIMMIEEEFEICLSPDEIIEMFEGYDSIVKILKNHKIDEI
jgi:acyl carrier protein